MRYRHDRVKSETPSARASMSVSIRNLLAVARRGVEVSISVAAEGTQFPWRWNGGAIPLNLGVMWEMSE
jgi:hypothetical protein